ncbi:hypothetical protein FB565_004636 [Actinoplanes lutulentus]|uniref:hypothetical protein n=1 Tax=Actinoplanes lutulentus TaxID=1287878 RepID=UPI0015EB7B38|nr:hypothetical protein [Actinoplanes lutulentus]MBB2944903.1 hypothetical protein [Actinoplanes lutulentus]
MTTAVALLWTMAVAGFVYAAGMVAVTPGTVGRFQDATSGSEVADNYVAVIWLGSAIGAVVALLIVALFTVLGVGLRRGSRLARGITLGVCVLGVIGGCGSVAAIGGQQSGDAVSGSLGAALNDAYPGGWIGLNAAVAVAQVIAYLLVAFLLLLAPRAFFGGASAAAGAGSGPVGNPAWGGPAAGNPAWGVPAAGNQGWGAPAGTQAGGAGWGAPAPANPYWGPGPSGGNPTAAPGTAGVNPGGGTPPGGFGYGNPPVYPSSDPAVTASPWAAPQSTDQYPQSDQSSSEADQNFVHPPVQKPTPRPEDEYWSRPSD